MKQKLGRFLKPRIWTIGLAVFLIAWQYMYAFRGIDLSYLASTRKYFGFGLSVINWNDFLIRTFSLGLIWLLVAMIIFFLLWGFEAIAVNFHNQKIAKKYANQPREDYAHLLRSRNVSFKENFQSYLWLSGFLILIPVGIFLVSGLVEMLRSFLVISFLTTAQDSGSIIDYNDVILVSISFVLTLPIWYLYAALDSWCFIKSKEDKNIAQIENAHFAVPIEKTQSKSEDQDSIQSQTGGDEPLTPVI